MTEEEWLNEKEYYGRMVKFVSTSSYRQVILCSIAWCRQFEHLLSPTLREVLDTTEAFVDGCCSVEKHLQAGQQIFDEWQLSLMVEPLQGKLIEAVYEATSDMNGGLDICFHTIYDLRTLLIYPEYPPVLTNEIAILRDIFGNPFRPVAFDPAWRTSAAIGLASTMYDSRNFNAMPILADAIQDAGCEDADILAHCRDEKQLHVRGCWVVDLVLNKS